MQSDLEALERFVAENDELLELEQRIGRFNIFDALKVARTEIRHSNFLAWLLSPNESHGQGDLFLKVLLMDLLRKARNQGLPVPVSAVDLDGADLHKVEIRREHRNIDLLVSCPAPSFVIAIENKVDSSEHSDQLTRYEKAVAQEYAGVNALFVYLTPSGDEASDEDWVAYSYNDVHRVFSRVRAQLGATLGGDVAVFLDHYLKLIGSRFMNDPDIDRLCRQIYANHPRAIELILERVDVGGSGLAATIARWFEARPKDWHVMYSHARYVKVYPTAWIGSLCDAEGKPKSGGCDLFWEFGVQTTVVKMRCVIGYADDPERRRRIIERLVKKREEFGFRTIRKTDKLTDRWTRLCSERLIEFTEDELPSEETLTGTMTAHMAKVHTKLDAIAAAIRSVV